MKHIMSLMREIPIAIMQVPLHGQLHLQLSPIFQPWVQIVTISHLIMVQIQGQIPLAAPIQVPLLTGTLVLHLEGPAQNQPTVTAAYMAEIHNCYNLNIHSKVHQV